MAFRESDGQFMWQMVHDKLAAGRVNDWPYQGVASSPLVEGDRVYYVSNRAELVCLDTQGFRDKENDGSVTDEKLKGETDGDVVWKFDMIEEVGSLPHNLANSSPVSYGDLIFVSTSNGQDESHVNNPSPKAPSIVAINKKTGKLVWEDNSVFDRILHGQWSTPAVGTIGGVVQVVSAQGDGQVRGYEALTGKKLWEFDTNPKDAIWPKTRNELIATPVIFQDRVKPDIVSLKAQVDAGAMGRPILASARVKWYRPPEYYRDSRWRGTWGGIVQPSSPRPGLPGLASWPWMRGCGFLSS